MTRTDSYGALTNKAQVRTVGPDLVFCCGAGDRNRTRTVSWEVVTHRLLTRKSHVRGYRVWRLRLTTRLSWEPKLSSHGGRGLVTAPSVSSKRRQERNKLIIDTATVRTPTKAAPPFNIATDTLSPPIQARVPAAVPLSIAKIALIATHTGSCEPVILSPRSSDWLL
jgi:hypothetical protein